MQVLVKMGARKMQKGSRKYKKSTLQCRGIVKKFLSINSGLAMT
jgi:hypothetical protein